MDIVGFPNYLIYEDGKVWGKWGKGRFMKPAINNQGYYFVNIRNSNKEGKNKLIHRLIAEHYIPNPENKSYVDHIDNCRRNYNITNLRWCSRQENQWNTKKSIKNKTGIKGVYLTNDMKYCSTIMCNGVKYGLGTFLNKQDAHTAYETKAKELFGDFYKPTLQLKEPS